MAIKQYFTAEYNEYYKQLEDTDSLEAYINTLSDSVSQVVQMSDSFCSDLIELSGKSIDQLDEDSQAFFKEIEDTKNKIETDLEEVVEVCNSLYEDLSDLQLYDNALQDDYDNYIEVYNDANATPTEKYNAKNEYDFSVSCCEETDALVKEEIQKLKDFNLALEEFSTQLLDYQLSFETAFQDEDMTYEEKLKLAIDKYQELFERRQRTLRANGQDGLVSVLNALGYPYDVSMDGPFNFESFKKLHAFINTPIVGRKTPIDVINDYFNGENWEDSGMAALAIKIGNNSGMKVQNASDPDYEAEFWYNMILQIDGRGETNDPTPYFLMSTDFYKQYGSSGSMDNFFDMMFVDYPADEDDPNWSLYTGEEYDARRQKYLNRALIASLKGEFIEEGYLDGLNNYVAEINQLNDNYGSDVLPCVEALDGRMDWSDNNAVIPKEAIMAYLAGASWEESELSAYCSKTEDEFLRDLVRLTGNDYEVYAYSDEEYNRNTTVGNNSYFTFNETSDSSIFAAVDSEHPSAEQVKGILRARGANKRLGDYYDHVNQRNDQIAGETEDMYVLSKTIQAARSELAIVAPTEADQMRERNERDGKAIAKDYLELIYDISGKDEHVHVMTQDEYVAKMRSEGSTLSRDEILHDYREAWQEEYRTQLIDERNYNPECARRMAAKQNYDAKLVVQCDDLSPLESAYYSSREGLAHAANAVGGLTSGGIDLARNVRHVVQPDLVPTSLEIAQDEIAYQYNDPNSRYYDPVKGSLYTVTRQVGHDAPIEILKAIPQTKTIGTTLEILDAYGKNVQQAYESNGGSWIAAELNASAKLGTDYAIKGISSSMGATSVTEKVFTGAITGEMKNAAYAGIDYATLSKSKEQAAASFAKGHTGIATKAFGSLIPAGKDINLTGNTFIDEFASNAMKSEGTALIKAAIDQDDTIFTSQGSMLGGAASSAGQAAGKKGWGTVKEKVKEAVNVDAEADGPEI